MDIITLALAKKFAKEYTDTHASKITEEDAIQAVANYFNENPNAIVTKNELEIILNDIAHLENLLNQIQDKLNQGTVVDNITVNEINNMIVEYFENKKVSEVEA